MTGSDPGSRPDRTRLQYGRRVHLHSLLLGRSFRVASFLFSVSHFPLECGDWPSLMAVDDLADVRAVSADLLDAPVLLPFRVLDLRFYFTWLEEMFRLPHF